MLLIEASKIIDLKFKMLTLERSTQMYTSRRRQIRLLPLKKAGEEGWEHVGEMTDCSGNGEEGAGLMLFRYRAKFQPSLVPGLSVLYCWLTAFAIYCKKRRRAARDTQGLVLGGWAVQGAKGG